jgi:hypothetical protein
MQLPQHEISSKSTNRFKSCTHLKSLNVRYYGIVEATRLKNMASRSSSISSPPYKISSNPPTGSKVAPPQRYKRPPFWSDRRHLQCHHLLAKFNLNPTISSNIRCFFTLTVSSKFKHPPFWNGWSYGIKKYGIEVILMPSPPHKISSKSTYRFKRCTHLRSLNFRHFGMIDITFNVFTSIQNFIQIFQSVQIFTHLKSLNVRHFWNP